jgi:site-specific recombinase XerC
VSYALAASSVLLLLLKLLPMFNQDTSLPMSVLLPANLGFALAQRNLVKRMASAAASVGSPSQVVPQA